MTGADAVVTTDRGRVRGLEHPGGFAFLGLPYAQAPFGPNRLAAPVAVEPWDGVRDAVEFAATAPQAEQGFTIIPEPIIDGGPQPACLSVNVFTPDLGDAGLPVLVWIHGGGYTSGTPSSAWYDGRSFARDGVVVVSVGYRLGAEGFLVVDGAPANRAVLDWLAALGWVQRNIAAFGGDPHRVTIGGQSAGGGACSTLATLPQARGLFHQVLCMSGTVDLSSSRDTARWVARAVADELGIEPTAAALARRTPAELVVAQTAGPARAAAAHSPEQGGPRPPLTAMPYRPVVDGEVVAVSPADAVRAGATHHLPILVGATAEEFVPAMRPASMDDARLARRLGRLGLDADGVAAYAGLDRDGGEHGNEDGNGARFGQAVTDAWFRVPAVRLAEARFDAAQPTFVYDFGWRSDALGGIGAVHCLDLPFAWDLLGAPGVTEVAGSDPPQDLADRMHRSWVDFIVRGDPGWPAYEPGHRATMAFGADSRVVDDLLGDERRRWP